MIFDETLPKDHELRQICGLKPSEKSSLIHATVQSHSVSESHNDSRVPSGIEYYSVKANLSEVRIVYFQRFIDEFLEYIYGTCQIDGTQ